MGQCVQHLATCKQLFKEQQGPPMARTHYCCMHMELQLEVFLYKIISRHLTRMPSSNPLMSQPCDATCRQVHIGLTQ